MDQSLRQENLLKTSWTLKIRPYVVEGKRFPPRRQPPCVFCHPPQRARSCPHHRPSSSGAPTRTTPKPNLAKGLCPDRAAQGYPQSSALHLCRPSLRSSLPLQLCLRWRMGDTPPLRLTTPAFARWRSACTCRVQRGTARAKAEKEKPP